MNWDLLTTTAAIAAALLAAAGVFVWRLAMGVMTAEALGSLTHLARSIVHAAADSLPATERENTEDTVLFIRVEGANVNFNEDGTFHSILDATTIRHLTDTLAVEQGLELRYIGGGEASFTDE